VSNLLRQPASHAGGWVSGDHRLLEGTPMLPPCDALRAARPRGDGLPLPALPRLRTARCRGLVIVNTHLDEDICAAGGLIARVAERGAPIHVLAVTDSDGASAALLRSANAVVCAPWYEPFGMVALEAMACERAVVATAVGGMQDTVVHGVTGLHVPPRRPDALAATLREVLAVSTLPAAFGVAGRARVLACLMWERVAAATERVYDEVLDERVGPTARAVGGAQ
jgi:glycosyltransferase involved in cell wall biosynthesis